MHGSITFNKKYDIGEHRTEPRTTVHLLYLCKYLRCSLHQVLNSAATFLPALMTLTTLKRFYYFLTTKESFITHIS